MNLTLPRLRGRARVGAFGSCAQNQPPRLHIEAGALNRPRVLPSSLHGGDMASTAMLKPDVHAEVQWSSLISTANKLVANDANYALAA